MALMTALAIFAVLWPLSRRIARPAGSDVEVYRDQLAEIDRDRAVGLIAPAEAEAARVEVSRRLIAAAEAAKVGPATVQATSPAMRRIAAVVALVGVPAVAVTLYLMLGSPGLPGAPLAERESAPLARQSLASLVAQAEARIARSPEDGRGWEVLAPVYLRLGRFEDAVKARRNALALNGETADRQSDLGEALVMASNGIVTADAKAAFDRAIALDSKQYKARFFEGLAAEQDGRKPDAAAIWQALIDDSPADAPWIATVRSAIAGLDGKGPTPGGQQPATGGSPPAQNTGPSTDDIAAASSMNETQRAEMIRGMVARLAQRLDSEASDIDGWLRLIRAYMVLGQPSEASAAVTRARRALAGDGDKLRRINELAAELGIKG